ncbi:Hsp70 family protein [Ornithinimicrobium pekingense]|uniref:Molecular chaperone n=1 Tax=Ornithinimicrobium pekingense TaxID=384677 RepID=A0ABQ2F7R0_9MICO|nr:Hsp70 family protein [Ornithinimicrobium pekingense]GGK68003.1 molecular chaperone [Ornithinimicrobium pekingense]
MDLGVDLGTTRTTVAVSDRGNYPVVGFLDTDDDVREWLPSVVARTGPGTQGLLFGYAALDAVAQGAPVLRSFKRAMAAPDVGPHTELLVGDEPVALADLLTGFLSALGEALRTRSTVSGEDLGRTVVSVPAHAHSAQRFLTLEAFRAAGFDVVQMVNEPSAAGFEYSHRKTRTLTRQRNRVVVYDLGGGTFDASLVTIDGPQHDVDASLGLNRLGGDDFDAVLADLTLARAGAGEADRRGTAYLDLLEQAREAKERLAPQSRRVVLDVAGEPVTVPVEDFYEAAAPLVTRTMEAMAPLVHGLDEGTPADVAGLYLVGGASALPLVPRLLRERFGRRVHRAPMPAASTAIGLAIASDQGSDYSLRDRLSRAVGVFREGGAGREVAFDQILGRDQRVVPGQDLSVRRRYRAAHNVGHFRFVEFTGAGGTPQGDLVPFGEVVVPFDPALRDGRDLREVPVRRVDGPEVEEVYTVDGNGMVEVAITDLQTGYAVRRQLGAQPA